jgi:hypothetical protein
MIATTVQINQVQTAPAPLISPEVMALALNKGIAAQVISWDTFGEINPTPDAIMGIFTNHDIFKFVLADGGAILIGADQFLNYWEQIQQSKPVTEPSPSQETIVALAKQQGTAVYAGCWKLGFVVQYKSDYYAVSEVLVHGKGYQYSMSRHSSFQLAADCLIEQSWTEEENRY